MLALWRDLNVNQSNLAVYAIPQKSSRESSRAHFRTSLSDNLTLAYPQKRDRPICKPFENHLVVYVIDL